MTVIQVHIPDELETALQQVPGDVEEFIVEAVRKQLNVPTQAAADADNDFLSPEDVQYYMNLPDRQTTALYQKGDDVFGSADAFQRWIEKPAYGLGGQVPLASLSTPDGVAQILDELNRIAHGDLA